MLSHWLAKEVLPGTEGGPKWGGRLAIGMLSNRCTKYPQKNAQKRRVKNMEKVETILDCCGFLPVSSAWFWEVFTERQQWYYSCLMSSFSSPAASCLFLSYHKKSDQHGKRSLPDLFSWQAAQSMCILFHNAQKHVFDFSLLGGTCAYLPSPSGGSWHLFVSIHMASAGNKSRFKWRHFVYGYEKEFVEH